MSSSPRKSSLSAEGKNATMIQERATLTQLLQAALEGNFRQLQDTVNDYCRRHDNEQLTPLQVILQFKDGKGRTALHFACQSRKRSTTEEQQKINENENEVDDDHSDIVYQMVCSGWLSSSSSVSSKSATTTTTSSLATLLRVKDKDGLTPLMLAAQVPDRLLAQRRVQYLLQADTTCLASKTTVVASKLGLARSHAGATALHYAAGARATRTCISMIYHAGTVALTTFSKQGGTPLHWACAAVSSGASRGDGPFVQQQEETIRALLECASGKDSSSLTPIINAYDTTIPPPLMVAMATGSSDAALLLLQYQTKNGKKSDDQASSVSCLDFTPTFQYVLSTGGGGGSNGSSDVAGITIFHMAADMNMVTVLQALLEHLGRVQPTTTDQINPWEWAMRPNESKETPLDVAAREGHVECVQLLLPFHQMVKNHSNGDHHLDDNSITNMPLVSLSEAQVYIEQWKRALPTARAGPVDTKESETANTPSAEASTTGDKHDTATTTATTSKTIMDAVETRAREYATLRLTQLTPSSSMLSPEAFSSSNEKNDSCNPLLISSEAVEAAAHAKQAGNDHFSKKEYAAAIEQYQIGMNHLEAEKGAAIGEKTNDSSVPSSVVSSHEAIIETLATLYSNRSACYLMMSQQQKIKNADNQSTMMSGTPEDDHAATLLRQALYDAVVARHLRPDWPKAAYRVAVARCEAKRYEDAAVAAWEGLQHDPENAELKSLLQKCVKKGRKEHLQQKQKNKK